MIKNKSGKFVYFKYSNLSKKENIVHFVSSRLGGSSKNIYKESNMSFTVGDDPIAVTQNRQKLLEIFGVSNSNCAFAELTHGTNIKIVKNIPKNTFNNFPVVKNADALVSNILNVCLIVTIADCVPITIYDKTKNIIAIVHAGWRGTVKNISSKVIEKMNKELGSDPKDILVGIGPSICMDDYEVGKELVGQFKSDIIKSDAVKKVSEDKWKLDLCKLNIYQLRSQGVLEKNIEISEYCTYENNDLFYSNRKEKVTGRFMSGIMLKNE